MYRFTADLDNFSLMARYMGEILRRSIKNSSKSRSQSNLHKIVTILLMKLTIFYDIVKEWLE